VNAQEAKIMYRTYLTRAIVDEQASIFIRPINKHYNIDDSNAQGQAARRAIRPNIAGHLAKKISKLKQTNKHRYVRSAGIQID